METEQHFNEQKNRSRWILKKNYFPELRGNQNTTFQTYETQ